MKTILKTSAQLLLPCIFCFISQPGKAQVWTYDFGTTIGVDTSVTASATFLPAPPDGVARVRVGTAPVTGSFTLSDPGIHSLGTNTELQIRASAGSVSPTKFSVYDYTPGKIGYVKFKISFSEGTDGVYNFSLGDGSSYNDNSSMNTNHIFAGIRWNFGLLNMISYQVLNNGAYVSSGISNVSSLFVQDTSIVYMVEVYANNNNVQKTYVRKGISHTLSADTWDLWVNNVKVGASLASGALPDNTMIDSYAFTHQSNALTPGAVYIDDIEYANILPVTSVIVSANTLTNFGSINIGSVSAATYFVINATNLTGDILITAPGNIELSRDNTLFVNSILLAQLNGDLIRQPDTIYVRYAPIIAGSMYDSIGISTAGTDIQKIAVSGTGIPSFSFSSDIITDTGFIYQEEINYQNYQAVNITPFNSIEMAKFIIRDGGVLQADADTLGTMINDITLQITHAEMIRSIALYDGSLELMETTPAASTRFTGLSVYAPDGGTKMFSVRITFLNTVNDHTQIVFTISHVVTDISGSIMSMVNAGGAATSGMGNDNRIAVVADRLVFTQQPATTNVNDTMSPAVVVSAIDASGNSDLDYHQSVSIVSGGILTTTPLIVTANAGIAVFSAIVHQSPADNITLYAISGSFSLITSTSFNVTEQPDTLVSFASMWSGTPVTVAATYQDAHLNGTVLLSRGNGLTAASSTSRFNSSNWPMTPVLILSANTSYLSFSITSSPGYKLNLNGAVLSLGLSSSASGPALFGVYSSVGGFVSTNQQIGPDLTTSSGGIVFPASGYDQLSSIEIRIYGWGSLTTLGTGGLSSMDLTGKNAAIRYVFDSVWSPADPSGTATAVNDIVVLSGNGTISANSECNNITINNGAFLTIASGVRLNINGAMSGFGKLSGSETSKLVINGSGSFGVLYPDQLSLSTRSLGALVINRGNNGHIVLGDSLDLYDSLSLYNGILFTQGKLRLRSTASKTAVIPEIKGTGSVSGDLIAEQFISGVARRWRFMSSPFSNATFEDLRQEIYITGAGSGNTAGLLNSNGFDATSSNQPSVYSYNEMATGNLNMGWVALTNSTASLSNQLFVPGKGYRIFIRGDRSDIGRLTGANPTQNQVAVDAMGTINSGTIPIPVSYTISGGIADDGWNLVGNPYPCAFNWQAFMDNGTYCSFIDSTIYILDATSGSYKSYNSFSRAGTLTNGIIPKGASFWVKANAPNPILVFAEQFKTTQSPVPLFKAAQQNELNIKLEYDSVTGDVFILSHHAASSVLKDPYDIRKMNGEVNIMSVGADGISLAYDMRPLSVMNDTVNLYVSGGNFSYTLKVNTIPSTGGKLYYLRDKKLNTVILLTPGISYPYISTAADTSSFGYRFQIIISNAVSLPVTFIHFRAIPAASSVFLEWQTEKTADDFHYEVERYTDKKPDWERLVIVNPNATNKVNQYYFVDDTPDVSGNNYYRIKCINYSHQIFYSIIQIASFGGEKKADPYVCPNPTSDLVRIVSAEPVKEIALMDLQGKQLLLTSGKELHLGSLRQGIYYLKIVGPGGEPTIHKIVKD